MKALTLTIMRIINLIACAFLFTLSSCYTSINNSESKKNQVIQIDENYFIPSKDNYADYELLKPLFQNWVHSIEEDKDSVMIFRVQDSKEFPHLRFRDNYIFFEGGKCKWYYLSPNDAHSFEDGLWMLGKKNSRVLKMVGTTKQMTQYFEIAELRKDLLRLRRL